MPARKRRMETRTRPPPRFRPQMANPGCRCQVSPSARSPYYGPFRVSFWAPLTWLTAFRRPYLPPQVASWRRTHWLTGGHDKQILDSLMHCGPSGRPARASNCLTTQDRPPPKAQTVGRGIGVRQSRRGTRSRHEPAQSAAPTSPANRLRCGVAICRICRLFGIGAGCRSPRRARHLSRKPDNL